MKYAVKTASGWVALSDLTSRKGILLSGDGPKDKRILFSGRPVAWACKLEIDRNGGRAKVIRVRL